MKVGWKVVLLQIAAVSLRVKQDFSESVGGARRHEASFAGRQIGDRNLQPLGRILQDDTQHVARIIEEGVGVRCKGVAVHKQRLEVQWAGRPS